LHIQEARHHPAGELIERLRGVTMLKDREARPYAKARISLVEMRVEDILPTQRYVLLERLLSLRGLFEGLARWDADPLALTGFTEFFVRGADEPFTLLPPVVEVQRERDGSLNPIVNDGMHRLFIARLSWRNPVVALIEDVPAEYPYSAHPIPGPQPWDKVEILPGGGIPESFLKKWHRQKDNKRLYRDFNSAFKNVGGPRGGGAV
jgi:hypothetical protein